MPSLKPILVLSLLMGATSVAQAKPQTTAPKEKTMSHTIEFKPGRVYEVTGIWVKPGQMEAINAYFGKVFPIATARYGVKPLFGLQPVNVHAGDFKPNIMFVNEWPSIEHFKRFTKDPDAVALFPERDRSISRLVVTQYTVPNEKAVTLREGDVIEYAAMWIQSGKEAELGAYYAEAIAVARKHHIEPMTPLTAVFGHAGGFMPDRAGLNLWGDLANFKAFEAEASALFPKRNEALKRLEVVHAAVRFGDGR